MITEGCFNVLMESSKIALRMISRSALEGFVKDVRGEPLHNYIVELFRDRRKRYSDLTALSGRFIISGIKPGQYDICISPFGETDYTAYDRFDKILLLGGMYKSIELTVPRNNRFSSLGRTYSQTDDSFVGINLSCNSRILQKEGKMGAQFVRGNPTDEYSLFVHNYLPEKVLAVITVDGLSIMDGCPGGLHSGGYIVYPGRVLEIKGWLIDESRIARFVFSSSERSYARLMREPTDLGVIGCAFFYEKPKASVIRFSLANEASDTSRHQESSNDIGTGFGRAENQQTTTIKFDREDQPFYLTKLFYIGNNQNQPSFIDENKNPFPGCRIPPGWSN